jgi:multidrug resistance efflux pump
MKFKYGNYVLPVLAAGMLVFSIIQVVLGQQKPPQPQPPVEPPRSPFGKTVAGAGVVEPRSENISVGAELPGLVQTVNMTVDDVGKEVKMGQVLCVIDNRQIAAQLALQEANLQAANAQLQKLLAQPRPEEVPPLVAALEAADFNFKVQTDTAQRNKDLYPQNAVPQKDYEQSLLLAEQAKRQKVQAESNLLLLKAGAWKYDIDIARANVAVAQAQVVQARTDLERLVVHSPIDGKVLQVNVRLGEYVGTPNSQALYVIGSKAPLNIRVDIDEHDIPRAHPLFKKEVKGEASPRGDPSMKFQLSFVRIEPYVIPKKSLTGDNTERVDTRVLQVIYQVEGDAGPLVVGMQVDVFIDVETGKK